MQRLRIGQIGWGTVGAAFGELVGRGPLPAEIVAVAVRDPERPRRHPLPPAAALTTPDDITAAGTPPVDVVVELAGGTDGPARWASTALSAGLPYVTANKALLATRGAELAMLARRCDAALLGSAAVGGGAPMIETVAHLAVAGRIQRLRGVLNATTNFMLTRMGEGSTYEEALKAAQDAGYAEPDPTFDVSGRDAAQKLAILASVAWGRWRAEAEVETNGIIGLPENGSATLRLVAEGTAERLRVGPVEVDPGSPLARVSGIENLLEVEVDGAGLFSVAGPGAGGEVTARAVYADLARLVAGERPVLFA